MGRMLIYCRELARWQGAVSTKNQENPGIGWGFLVS
jgi:hypothetical protein